MMRRLAAEGLGTMFLLMTVIGSGIMGERLSQGNDAIALLANSLATGCALAVLILLFGPVSGAHFNPVVTFSFRHIKLPQACAYAAVQVIAAFAGVAAAHMMFGEDIFSFSGKIRTGWAQYWSEFIATFGLLLVIHGLVRQKSAAIPFAVAGYITAAYWFTASTSFANPSVTIARAFSDSFAGIRIQDVPYFIAAQVCGALAATLFASWLWKKE